MLTEKDYCDYDTCVALKELGYNRGAYAYYFPNHKEDLIFNTHQMRGCSINEMLKGYNTYPKDVMGHELIDAPTMWEAQKWLREEKHIDALVYLDDLKGYFPFIKIWEGSWKTFIILEEMEDKKVSYFVNYEEALAEGLRTSIKILRDE